MSKLLINIPEVIQTPRLKLQMPKAGFSEKLHKAISDGYDDYIKWLNWPKNIPTIEMLEEECRKNNSEFILRDLIRYIIIEKESDEVIGRCAFPPFQSNWDIPQFGISYFICKSKRNNGYAAEAVHAMSSLAFKVIKAKKLEIYCDVENTASIKVPLKLGFKLEYTQRGGWLRENGELAKLNTYAIFSEESLPDLEIKW